MSFLNMVYGSKPDVPDLPRVDLAAQQGAAARSNLAALPANQGYVSAANRFSIDQINQMLASAIPGYMSSTGAGGRAIENMLMGRIPISDEAMVHNQAVASALGGGYGGSGAMANRVARDYGLTEMGLVQQGLDTLQSWMRTAASIYEPQMINVGSFAVTPQQLYSAENEQNLQQFQRSWMEEQISARPDPVIGGVHQDIMSLIQAYLGTMGGGKAKGAAGGFMSAGANDVVQPGMDFAG